MGECPSCQNQSIYHLDKTDFNTSTNFLKSFPHNGVTQEYDRICLFMLFAPVSVPLLIFQMWDVIPYSPATSCLSGQVCGLLTCSNYHPVTCLTSKQTAGEDVTSTSLNWRCQTTGLQSLKGFLGKLWLVWRRRELFSHVLIGVGEGRGKCYMAWGAEGCETGIVGQLIPLHSVGRWSSVAGDLPNWCRVVSWKPVSSFERVFWKVPSYSEVFFYQGLFLLCVWDHCRVGQWSCCHMVDQIRINYSIK